MKALDFVARILQDDEVQAFASSATWPGSERGMNTPVQQGANHQPFRGLEDHLAVYEASHRTSSRLAVLLTETAVPKYRGLMLLSSILPLRSILLAAVEFDGFDPHNDGARPASVDRRKPRVGIHAVLRLTSSGSSSSGPHQGGPWSVHVSRTRAAAIWGCRLSVQVGFPGRLQLESRANTILDGIALMFARPERFVLAADQRGRFPGLAS